MKRIAAFVGGLALAVAQPVIAAEGSGFGMYGIKIGVKDFQKAIDFYTLLGMKMGPKHNAAEWQLSWDNPSQGSNIILVHDDTGRMKLAPGGSFLMMQVPDVKAVAGKLKSSGYPGVGEPMVTPRSTMLMLKDPDGNQIEMLGPTNK